MPPGVRWDVNLSMLFPHLPVERRAQAAADAGFRAVESWWPFEVAVPGDAQVDAFVRSVRDAGVRLVLLNAYGGDLGAGERGLAALPGREVEARDALAAAAGLVELLGCPVLHVLHGRASGPDARERVLGHLREAVAATPATVVLEALSAVPGYPLRTAADVLSLADEVPGVRLLADLHHLTVDGDDVRAVLREQVERIGHVQVADVPGRGAPGTGQLDVAGLLAELLAAGYAGHVGLEHLPGDGDPFAWLPRDQRAGPAGPVRRP